MVQNHLQFLSSWKGSWKSACGVKVLHHTSTQRHIHTHSQLVLFKCTVFSCCFFHSFIIVFQVWWIYNTPPQNYKNHILLNRGTCTTHGTWTALWWFARWLWNFCRQSKTMTIYGNLIVFLFELKTWFLLLENSPIHPMWKLHPSFIFFSTSVKHKRIHKLFQ